MVNEHLSGNQADANYKNLGGWTYDYDAASNPTTMTHAGTAMDELETSQTYAYDSLNRLITCLPKDSQDWSAVSQKTSPHCTAKSRITGTRPARSEMPKHRKTEDCTQ